MNKHRLTSLFISKDTTLKGAMQRLNKTSMQILLITEPDTTLTGTLSDGDIRRALVRGVQFSDPVKKIMRKKYRFVSESDKNKLHHAKTLMLKAKLQHIPVLDKNKKVRDLLLWKELIEDSLSVKRHKHLTNPVVIMAGGMGSRLEPFTKILPKPLIPIGDKPILEIIMERFFRHGFKRFILTLNHKKEYIKLFLRDNPFPYEISFVEEKKILGTAGSLALLSQKINETFFVTNCDTLLDIDFQDVLHWHKRHRGLMTIIGTHREVTIPYGVLKLHDGEVSQIDEKPRYDILINTGTYVIEPSVIKMIPKSARLDMNRLITSVIRQHKVSVYPISEGWIDFGQWEEYKKSVKILGGV